MPTDTTTTNQIEFIARALILHDSYALMCRSVAGEYFYLPGGHIEFSEPASQALKRELLEESNQKITVGPLLLTAENTFHDGHRPHHEINLVFQAQLFHVEQFTQIGHPDPAADPSGGGGGSAASDGADGGAAVGGGLPVVESAEEHIDFVWVDLAAVTDLDIRPTQIKAWLASGGMVASGVAGDQGGGVSGGGQHLVGFEIPVSPTAGGD